MKLAALAAIAACAAACDRRPPITSCTDNLTGVWDSGAGTWMLIDNGGTIEAYPLFPDAPAASPGVITTPRVMDLARDRRGFGGTIARRYMQGTAACNAKITVHVNSCSHDTLELILADPAEPAFTPDGCKFTRPPPSRLERWRR